MTCEHQKPFFYFEPIGSVYLHVSIMAHMEMSWKNLIVRLHKEGKEYRKICTRLKISQTQLQQ